MNTFDFILAAISHTLKDPHSKALEPDCLSPSVFNYDAVSKGRGRSEGILLSIHGRAFCQNKHSFGHCFFSHSDSDLHLCQMREDMLNLGL